MSARNGTREHFYKVTYVYLADAAFVLCSVHIVQPVKLFLRLLSQLLPRIRPQVQKTVCQVTRGGSFSETYSQLIPLSGVAVQARHAAYIDWNRVHPK
jgi:hypothetical protein